MAVTASVSRPDCTCEADNKIALARPTPTTPAAIRPGPGPAHDPLWLLQHAARAFVLAASPTAQADRIQVRDAAGKIIVSIPVPPPTRAEVSTIDVHPVAGWDFTGRTPRYDGQPVPTMGRRFALLKMLAESDDPVPAVDLLVCWKPYPAEEATVRYTVAELRKDIKKAFPDFEGDPIPATGRGYQLLIR